jgi:exosortase/archaeosortase family protein
LAGTGVLAHYYGPQAALGFFHTFSGWLVFLAAFGILFAVVYGIRRLAPEAPPRLPEPEVSV